MGQDLYLLLESSSAASSCFIRAIVSYGNLIRRAKPYRERNPKEHIKVLKETFNVKFTGNMRVWALHGNLSSASFYLKTHLEKRISIFHVNASAHLIMYSALKALNTRYMNKSR